MGFIPGIQGWFNNKKIINKIHHYKLNKKSHMIISVDVEKAFDKIQSLFIIKTPSKSGIKNVLINSILKTYITLNGERLNVFP